MTIATRRQRRAKSTLTSKESPLARARKTRTDALRGSNPTTLQHSPRAAWSEASRKIAAAGDDALVWPQFANESDAKRKW
jgi:hypothetical protein